MDEFGKGFKEKGGQRAGTIAAAMKAKLDLMANVFVDDDWLLQSVGMITLYYYLFRDASAHGWIDKIARSALDEFETKRRKNRDLAENDDPAADYHLLEFDRFAQSPNDAIALRYRYAVLRKYIGPRKGRPVIPGEG